MNVFQAAKQISCSDAARRLGLTEKHGRWLCPFHEDHHPSMACYEDSRRFYCFACHAKGDAVDLWAKVKGMSLKEAADDLCRAYGLSHTPESREDIERRRHREDVGQIPQAVLQDWHRGMIALLEEEVNACVRMMEAYHDTECWMWKYALNRAIRLNDEANRLKALALADIGTEVAERRRGRIVCADQPGVSDELLGDILADRLRYSGVRLTAQERAGVHQTLGITPQAGNAAG